MVTSRPIGAPLQYHLDRALMGDGRESRVLFELRDLFVQQLRIHELYAEELGVHPTDLRALDLISRYRREPLTMGRLASLLRLSTGAVTGTVDRLEESGLVERVRDDHDRRRVLLRVTEQAERVTTDFSSIYTRRIRDVLEAFDEDELAVCERFLGALALTLCDE